MKSVKICEQYETKKSIDDDTCSFELILGPANFLSEVD